MSGAVGLSLGFGAEQLADSDLTEPRWTTTDMVHPQARILNDWTAGHDTGHLADFPGTAIDNAVTATGIDPDEANLLRARPTSRHQFQAAIGRPGPDRAARDTG